MKTAHAAAPAKRDIVGDILNCTKNIAAIATETTAIDTITRPSRPPGSRFGSTAGTADCIADWPTVAVAGAALAAFPAGGFEMSCFVIVFQVRRDSSALSFASARS